MKVAANGSVAPVRGGLGVEEYAGGAIILYPGPSSFLYRLTAGLVRLHSVDQDGYGVTLRYVKPGGYFGDEAFTGHDRRYFAEAITDSAAQKLDPTKLDRQGLLDVIGYMSLSMDHMNRSLLRLAGKPLRARVAAELLELADSALAGRTEAGKPIIHLTHDDLAAAVGSVRETVTKVVGELARQGALRAGYAKIVISDRDLLAQIADN